MKNFYRLESDPKLYINLNSDTELLEDTQRRLHILASFVTRDLEVITNELVNRRTDIEFVPFNSEGNYIEVKEK